MARSMASTAVIKQFEGKIGREPRMHMMADRSNEKFNLHLNQCSIVAIRELDVLRFM